MFQRYYTNTIVIAAVPFGEADKTLTLFTQQFGLLHARARGIRRERSRLRFALQRFSYATVALVRGKGGWQLVGATCGTHATNDPESIMAQARIAGLVERLVLGEERNEYLFHTLREAHEAFAHADGKTRREVEILTVARVLYSLGYMAPPREQHDLFAHTGYDHHSCALVQRTRRRMLRSINSALAETQL